MKRKLLMLALTASFLLCACQSDPPATAAQPLPITSPAMVSTSAKPPAETGPVATVPVSVGSTKPTGTTPVASYPTSGILSDPIEYQPGNPKTHAFVALEPDPKILPDKTRSENDRYRPVFEEYLKFNYPEQTFRLVSIESYQQQGTTYKRATAYSTESSDIIFNLFYDGTNLFDTFEKDVVSRQTTMNRWRFEFRKLLDPISRRIADDDVVNLDVSYDYYKENIEMIKLDQRLDPKSDTYRHALELYFNIGYTNPAKVSSITTQIYQSVEEAGYFFQEYFIYLESTNGIKTAYQIPSELFGDPSFPVHLQKALSDQDPTNLIKLVERLRP